MRQTIRGWVRGAGAGLLLAGAALGTSCVESNPIEISSATVQFSVDVTNSNTIYSDDPQDAAQLVVNQFVIEPTDPLALEQLTGQGIQILEPPPQGQERLNRVPLGTANVGVLMREAAFPPGVYRLKDLELANIVFADTGGDNDNSNCANVQTVINSLQPPFSVSLSNAAFEVPEGSSTLSLTIDTAGLLVAADSATITDPSSGVCILDEATLSTLASTFLTVSASGG